MSEGLKKKKKWGGGRAEKILYKFFSFPFMPRIYFIKHVSKAVWGGLFFLKERGSQRVFFLKRTWYNYLK